MLPSVFYLSEAFIQLFTHIEMSSNLSAKYYEDSKERPKKVRQRYQSLSKEQNEKSYNIRVYYQILGHRYIIKYWTILRY